MIRVPMPRHHRLHDEIRAIHRQGKPAAPTPPDKLQFALAFDLCSVTTWAEAKAAIAKQEKRHVR